MFTIYNNGTVGFRSTSDNLYNLQTVEEAEPVRFEPKDGLVQDFSNELNKQHKQDFLESYKKIANLDTLEPVYQIKDIMTKDVIYMDNKSTVEDVYNTIRSKKVHQIPITAFGKKIIGIVNKKVILNLLMNDIENAEKIVRNLKKANQIVIVSFHGGSEGEKNQHVTKKTEIFYGQNRGNVYQFAHRMIDAGADIVIGHGPHVVRAVELYNNKFIAYSLGNFCT